VSPDQTHPLERLVIVGAGMAANRFIGELAERCPDRYAVTVIGAEPHRPYNRILLSPLLGGEKHIDDLILTESSALPGVSFHLGDPVAGIDREQRIAITASGARFPYDKLMLCTGSDPIRPKLPGSDLPGVFTFRDRADADALIAASAGETARRAVVVGGGLLGLEAACGLARRGMTVAVVHLMDWIMERQLDPAAGALLQASLESRGVAVVTTAETEAILGEDHATGLRLKDGRILPADLVVFAIGVRPNTALAKSAGLAVARGILVDDALTTSDPVILAIGECVEHRGAIYGLVAPLWEQAAVAAAVLAGDADCRYGGSMTSTSLKVTGVELFSAGDIQAAADVEEIVFEDTEAGIYRKLVVRGGRLAGAVLLGDARDGNWYLDLIRGGADIGSFRGDLVFGRDFITAEAAE
jgi:nitrite reductase (NADH) large subunit